MFSVHVVFELNYIKLSYRGTEVTVLMFSAHLFMTLFLAKLSLLSIRKTVHGGLMHFRWDPWKGLELKFNKSQTTNKTQ